ncbi:hypothetical protein AFK68_19155, partial [Hydrocoleum sp. CS-953]|uniref:hypothetical protein n=2 Tax=Microcoleaceae TaxID=1892252 RepID=UPI000BC65138
MSESNDPETERQESNALSKVIEIVQKYPIITYLGTIVAAFGMGFASYGAIIGVNSNKIISQEKFDHLSQTEKCLNKLIENQLKYSFNIEECKKYPFLGEMKIVLTANELQLNRDKNDGKIGISGNISSQDFIGNDGLIKKKTKVWIISSYFDLNQQRKCYREGFLAGKDYDIN